MRMSRRMGVYAQGKVKVRFYGLAASSTLGGFAQACAVNAGNDFLLFALDDYQSSVVVAYNKDLESVAASNLSQARWQYAMIPIPNASAIIAGGQYGSNVSTAVTTCDTYSPTLVKGVLSLPSKLTCATGAHVGTHGILAGGRNASGTLQSAAYSFDAALTRATISPLSQARMDAISCNVGDYTLIAGGWLSTYNWSGVVDAFNSALTRSTPTDLSVAGDPQAVANASVGDFGLICGLGGTTAVDAFNTALTRVTPTSLSNVGTGQFSGTSLKGAALIATAGPYSTPLGTLDWYDKSLVRTSIAMQTNEDKVAGTVGKFAIFKDIVSGASQPEVYVA